jgi:DNA replication protein DnaC
MSYAQLEQQLTELHLAAIRQQYRPLAQKAAQANWSFETYLAQLIDQEYQRRTMNRRRRRIKEAKFPLLKELADFDYTAIPQLNKQRVLSLAEGAYLEQAEPVILVGNPGLGKTHVAIGLALTACRQGHRVRFYTVTQLVNELSSAQQEHQLPKLLEKLRRHKLLVLDEFGYVPFSPTGAQLLFQCCSHLSERTSLIITTNLPFSEWVSVLGDERLTNGLLDRLTFRSHILEFVGHSYRLQQQLNFQGVDEEAGLATDDPSPSTFDSPKVAKARLPNPL